MLQHNDEYRFLSSRIYAMGLRGILKLSVTASHRKLILDLNGDKLNEGRIR